MPASAIDQREAIAASLADFASSPLADAARRFFAVLGYKSDRRLPIATARAFCESFDPNGKLTQREREQLDSLTSLHLLFQLTDSELTSQRDMLSDPGAVENTRIHSYLFFAAELPAGACTRTFLSGIARAINKPLPMPALVLIRHGDSLSLAILHRRLNKREADKDVLEKATLIKDIAFADPIRAHLEILNDFVLANLDADFGTSNFVSLHNAWQKRLGSYALSNDFYREIADWYFWAHHQVDDGTLKLPLHCDTEEEKSLFLIRLLTRLIFCWFLVEKRLLPPDLFRRKNLIALLGDFSMAAPSYYQAVLQNLFFGTLNMPVEQRGFREKKKEGERYDKNRGITNLWRYGILFRDYDKARDLSAAWAALAVKVPFLNGGLFDCLDDKTGKKPDNSILDGFSDNPNESCHLPNDLFFGAERTVDLSKDYGEEDKRTARSKRAKVRGLIEILARYKFTIEENTPLEEEIALDPELLGKVFENLLASYNEDTRTTARKALGAFYTPREIVSYMVDEALRSYLATQVPAVPEKALRDLFSAKATPPEIKPAQREALVAAIGRVKILDPACGSGAFPMGALHRLVDLLQKLDPNNESWKRDRLAEARRYRELLEEAGADQDEIADCDSRIADIEKSFNTRFHALDFARKLYLIENCIYGVDIQPIATQIAKLRFFISLIVDQKVDPAAPNLGVRPLPNLETRLVAADTLIPIEKQSDLAHGELFSGDIDRLRAELARIRHEHFNARDPRKKTKWREADAAKREELAELLKTEHGMPKDAAKKLATWDPYDQNEHAPFFDPGWMFGIPVGKVRLEGKSLATLRGNLALINEVGGQAELVASNVREIDSGFDVVIGNPPYVRQEKIKHLKPLLQPNYPDTFTGTADLYVFFYDRALQLLRGSGTLSFITSNKWYRAAYGEKLRAHLGKTTTLLHAIDFGDAPVFTAIAYPTIVIARKGEPPPKHSFHALNWDPETPDTELANFAAFYDSKATRLAQNSLESEGWRFLAKKGQDIIDKIRAAGKPLGEFVRGRFFYGIKTGFNDAFIVDRATRDRLIAEHESSAKLLKPFLRGRDVKRWRIEYEDLWLIFTRRGTDISKYPALKAHLARYRKQLEPKPADWPDSKPWEGRKAGSYKWFEIQDNIAYWQEFAESKVLYPDISMEPRFALDVSGAYPDCTLFLIPAAKPWFPAVLNSRLGHYFLSEVTPKIRGGFLRFKSIYMEQVPIPDVGEQDALQLVLLQAIAAFLAAHIATDSTHARDPLMLAYFEQILNGLVYELYFPDEVHGAGLRLFDLAAAANLPAPDALPEAQRLPRLRQLFETLHDGTHPLKIALQKLQTLDTVRIIEGKA